MMVTVALAAGAPVGKNRNVNVVDSPTAKAVDENPLATENGPALISDPVKIQRFGALIAQSQW